MTALLELLELRSDHPLDPRAQPPLARLAPGHAPGFEAALALHEAARAVRQRLTIQDSLSNANTPSSELPPLMLTRPSLTQTGGAHRPALVQLPD